MLACGDISRVGQVLLLGLCDGDTTLAEATRAAIFNGGTVRQCAAEAGMHRSTFDRHVQRVKERLKTLINERVVTTAELVEQDDD